MPVPFVWKNVRLDGGGYFQRVIPHPTVQNKVVAGCDIAGFYLWDSFSRSWSLVGDFDYSGRNYWGAASFAWHPTDANTFWFAAGQYITNTQSLPGGVFKSTDGGVTLTKLNFPSIPFGSNENEQRLAGERLSVCPTNPSILVFGVYSSSTAQGKGLYRSIDCGTSWTQLDHSVIAPGQVIPSVNNANGTTFTCWDNQTPGVCYCGIFGLGVSRSTDYGATWTFIGGGYYPYKGKSVNGTLYLASMPSDKTFTAIAGDNYTTVAKYSTGTGWVTLTNNSLPLGIPIAWIDVNPFNVNDLVCGHAYLKYFYRSINAGATWNKITIDNLFQSVPYQDASKISNTEGIGAMMFDPTKSGRVWLGNFYYVIKTENIDDINGAQWISYGKGIENTVPFDLSIPLGSGDILLSGWFDVEGFVHSRGFDKVPLNKFGGSAAGDSSIYRNWCCLSVTYAPSQPATYLRVSSDYTAAVADVVKSIDRGLTWTKINSVSAVQRIACAATDANTWVVVRKGLPPAYTTDGGVNWTVLNSLPNFLNYVFNYSMPLVNEPGTSNFYYFDDNVSNSSTYGNLYKLTKSGSTISGAVISATKLPRTYDGSKTSTFRTIAGEIWGCFFDLGLWQSVDGGVNFTKIAAVNECQTFCFGASDVGYSVPTLYMYGNLIENNIFGVWMSQNKGATWQLVSDNTAKKLGLQSFTTQMCASLDTFGVVVMGTNGHGAIYGLATPPTNTSVSTGEDNTNTGAPVLINFI